MIDNASVPKTVADLNALAERIQVELAACTTSSARESFRLAYLGKKGLLKSLLKGLKELPEAERRAFGGRANELHDTIEAQFNAAAGGTDPAPGQSSWFDHSLPAFPFAAGTIHPLTTIRNRIRDIFAGMGFDVASGPEVESDWYNFEALNTPPHHPARDMQDTFYISDKTVLRTHTSPVQIRVMQNQKPPIRTIMPGRVYRNEAISARSYCLFHQVEGLYVDRDVNFADLKATLLEFARRFFNDDTRIKIRPSFFPFTEPSVEIDVECFLCKGTGCAICKRSGWLEILGAGMVHPNVFKSVGIDPEEYTGFAFGMGIERIALLRYGIDDIRLFYENDVRFLKQF